MSFVYLFSGALNNKIELYNVLSHNTVYNI
jgi:hypothetical protein